MPWATDDQALNDLFAKYGQVMSAVVLKDKMTGRSRGFGFVEMSNDQEAEEAIKGLNGSTMNERRIVVNEARPKEER